MAAKKESNEPDTLDLSKMYFPFEAYKQTKENMQATFEMQLKFWIKYPGNKLVLIGLIREMFGEPLVLDNLKDLEDKTHGEKVVMIGPIPEVHGEIVGELQRVLDIARSKGIRLIVFSDKHLFDAMGGMYLLDEWMTPEKKAIVKGFFQLLYEADDLTRYFKK